MAYIKTSKKALPTTVENFLGLNISETGETQLKLGEASKMKNFRITKDYKLSKMQGYTNVYTAESKIRAMWFGKLGSEEVFVYVSGGKVYNASTQIGTLTDDVTSIFEFNKVLYFINGHEYKKWDGTTFSSVEGYIPLVKIATTPEGVGTDYEPLNILTGKKHQTFSADGTSTEFFIAEKEVTSIDHVYVDGVEATVTKDTTNGKVTFSTAPAQGVDNVDVYWTKGSGSPTQVTSNYFAQKYGLASDTRVFVYGNKTAKNRIYFSDLGNGVPNVEYFPTTNFIDVGSSNEFVTDISRQYDRLIISKESETYYSTYEQISDLEGNTIVAFPTYPLNASHGMVAKGQGQLLDNYVTTIDGSIVQWINTQSKDERNAEIISQRVQEWLNSKDLTKAVTLDYQELKEYWLAIDNQVMVYNYGNSTYYLLEFPVNVTSLCDYGGTIYMGASNGKIYEFDDSRYTYAGTKIKSEWESGFYDFELEYRRKTMRILWITLKPELKTSLKVNYISDRDAGEEDKEISMLSMTFANLNFGNMGFDYNATVKPFKIKLKAKKFTFLKLILTNEKTDERVTVNSISIKKNYGGETK